MCCQCSVLMFICSCAMHHPQLNRILLLNKVFNCLDHSLDVGFSKIKKIAPGTRWLWHIHTTKEVRAMKSGRDLTVLGTTQTQGEKLLCTPNHFQCETQRWGWRQQISDQLGSISQGAWQWSQHTYNLPCHTLYQDHSKRKRDLIQKEDWRYLKKATNSSQFLKAT